MRLGVNIDHVATVREARKTDTPDPVAAAAIAEMAGADGVVCHLREDRRHFQDRDLFILKETVKSHLNLEMAPTEEMLEIAEKVKPDMVTFVPEKREEITTEGGLDIVGNFNNLEQAVKRLRNAGVIVSLFIDPDMEQVKSSAKAGADFIELHTGKYSEAKDENVQEEELEKLQNMALAGSKFGMSVGAGHGLDYFNVQPVAKLDKIIELNIGHSIIARSIMVGLDTAIRDMINLIK